MKFKLEKGFRDNRGGKEVIRRKERKERKKRSYKDRRLRKNKKLKGEKDDVEKRRQK